MIVEMHLPRTYTRGYSVGSLVKSIETYGVVKMRGVCFHHNGYTCIYYCNRYVYVLSISIVGSIYKLP